MNKTQWAVLLGAVLIFVLLYFAPGVGSSKDAPKNAGENVSEHGIEVHMEEFLKELAADQVELISSLQKQAVLAQGEEKVQLLDSLIKLWDANKNPVASAVFAFNKAKAEPSKDNWSHAAERLYYSARFAEGHLQSHVYEKAIESYQELLIIHPDNVDAQINLGVCYVESSKNPMQGIGMLKEVLVRDSLNVKAHLNLGYFSLKSGQYDKAIERFEKVVLIDSTYVEAYLYLGDVYETKGNIEQAIEHYSAYANNVKNPELSAQIDSYIEKLKSN